MNCMTRARLTSARWRPGHTGFSPGTGPQMVILMIAIAAANLPFPLPTRPDIHAQGPDRNPKRWQQQIINRQILQDAQGPASRPTRPPLLRKLFELGAGKSPAARREYDTGPGSALSQWSQDILVHCQSQSRRWATAGRDRRCRDLVPTRDTSAYAQAQEENWAVAGAVVGSYE